MKVVNCTKNACSFSPNSVTNINVCKQKAMQATIFHVRIFIVIYLIHFNNVNIDILNVFTRI